MTPRVDFNDSRRDAIRQKVSGERSLTDVLCPVLGPDQKIELIPFPVLPLTNGDLPRTPLRDAQTSDNDSTDPNGNSRQVGLTRGYDGQWPMLK